jgi:acyl-ACP thioesterase
VTIPARLERTYRVRFDEAGPDGNLRSSGLLRFAQDLAWIHSESAGFGREWYAAQQLTWLVHAIELDVLAETPYGAELVVSTEVTGFRRFWARRRSEFRAPGDARLTAVALTDWVLLNALGVPTRVPQPIAERFPVAGAGAFTPMRIAPPAVPAGATRQVFDVRRSELDPMAHVNNAAYLDYLDEQFLATGSNGRVLPLPRRYRAEFLASAEPGGRLTGVGWPAGDGWCYRLVGGDRRDLFRALLESDVRPPAGA